MAYIILTVAGFIGVLIVKDSWKTKVKLSVISSIILIAILLYLLIDIKIEITKGKGIDFLAEIPFLEISSYFVMIAGMAAKYLFDAIGEEKFPVFNKWQLIKPIVISPIVFGTVYGWCGESIPAIPLLIFAFQNGFFWKSVS